MVGGLEGGLGQIQCHYVTKNDQAVSILIRLCKIAASLRFGASTLNTLPGLLCCLAAILVRVPFCY